jgi:hypothetical protein
MQKWAHKGWFNKNSAQGHDLEQKYYLILTERWKIGTNKQQSANFLNFLSIEIYGKQ